MLTVTKKAAAVLKAAKAAEGAANEAGIRIRKEGMIENDGMLAVGLDIADEPEPDDEEFEQQGLRIFVEDALVEPLDGRTLDVSDANEGPELIWR